MFDPGFWGKELLWGLTSQDDPIDTFKIEVGVISEVLEKWFKGDEFE